MDGSLNPVEVPKHANFGKVFEKAMLITKYKGKEQGPEDPDSEVFIDKYVTKVKPKQSFLPGNLSSLISKHRKEMIIEEEAFDHDEPKLDDRTEHVHDDNVDDKDDDTGGHSWNVPVSKLIRDDEKEAVKKSKRLKKEAMNDGRKEAENKSGIEHLEGDVEMKTMYKGKSDIDKVRSEDAAGLREAVPQKKIQNSSVRDRDNDKNINTFDYDSSSDGESPKPKSKRKAAVKSTKGKSVTGSRKATKKRVIESDEDIEKPAKYSGDSDVEDKGEKKRKKATKAQPAAKKRKTNAGTVVIWFRLLYSCADILTYNVTDEK